MIKLRSKFLPEAEIITEEPEVAITDDGLILIFIEGGVEIELSPIELRRIRDKCNEAIKQIVGDIPGLYH